MGLGFHGNMGDNNIAYRGDTGRILSIESEVELGYLALVREDWVERTNGIKLSSLKITPEAILRKKPNPHMIYT